MCVSGSATVSHIYLILKVAYLPHDDPCILHGAHQEAAVLSPHTHTHCLLCDIEYSLRHLGDVSLRHHGDVCLSVTMVTCVHSRTAL